MNHPYSSQPSRAFWSRAVSRVARSEVDPVSSAGFLITPETKVATAGSCFAQHISRRLSQIGVEPFVTERPHDEVASLGSDFHYSIYTARYGNIYTSRQLLQLFKRAYGNFQPAEEAWRTPDERWVDPLRPSIPGGFATLREIDADRDRHLAAVRTMFEHLDVMVFTLGLTETWEARADGTVFPSCPGTIAGTWSPERYRFVNLTVDEVVADLTEFLSLLAGVNPQAKALLTVSPVPLVATATDSHVLPATIYSKSVLRVAVQSVSDANPHVDYFPSYEIITGPQAGTYFADDRREVRPEGVAAVMDVFASRYVFAESQSPEPATISDEQSGMAGATRRAARAIDVVCEELANDSGWNAPQGDRSTHGSQPQDDPSPPPGEGRIDFSELNELLVKSEPAKLLAKLEEVERSLPRADFAYYRGVAQLQLGRPLKALADLAVSAKAPDRAFWSHHWSGRAHETLGRSKEAAFAFLDASKWSEDVGNVTAFRTAALKALARGDLAQGAREELCGELDRLLSEATPAAAAASRDTASASDVERLGAALAALERRQVDLEVLLAPSLPAFAAPPFRLETRHPVALASDDHLHPRGAAQDNTRSPRFVRACEAQLGARLKALDLGCAGGGLVRDFLLRGHRAAGLEGSDLPQKAQRGEWRVIGRHLHTCDLLQPFALTEADGAAVAFDVITAWEVLEHLPAERLPVFFDNVRRHLAPTGRFVASVAQFPDEDPSTGAVWHVTLQPPSWWAERLAEGGLRAAVHDFAVADFVRGSGNGPRDWDARTRPDMGFHIVAELAPQA